MTMKRSSSKSFPVLFYALPFRASNKSKVEKQKCSTGSTLRRLESNQLLIDLELRRELSCIFYGDRTRFSLFTDDRLYCVLFPFGCCFERRFVPFLSLHARLLFLRFYCGAFDVPAKSACQFTLLAWCQQIRKISWQEWTKSSENLYRLWQIRKANPIFTILDSVRPQNWKTCYLISKILTYTKNNEIDAVSFLSYGMYKYWWVAFEAGLHLVNTCSSIIQNIFVCDSFRASLFLLIPLQFLIKCPPTWFWRIEHNYRHKLLILLGKSLLPYL